MLWVEQLWNVHPQKVDCEIFEDGPSAKIGSLENFRPYGTINFITEQQSSSRLTERSFSLQLEIILQMRMARSATGGGGILTH